MLQAPLRPCMILFGKAGLGVLVRAPQRHAQNDVAPLAQCCGGCSQGRLSCPTPALCSGQPTPRDRRTPG